MRLEGIASTWDVAEGDAMPIGYIAEFQRLEVDVDDGVAEIGGICGRLGWSLCWHCNLWHHKRLSFPWIH